MNVGKPQNHRRGFARSGRLVPRSEGGDPPFLGAPGGKPGPQQPLGGASKPLAGAEPTRGGQVHSPAELLGPLGQGSKSHLPFASPCARPGSLRSWNLLTVRFPEAARTPGLQEKSRRQVHLCHHTGSSDWITLSPLPDGRTFTSPIRLALPCLPHLIRKTSS